MARGAVVIGGYVNGLGLVRALAARGIPAAVIKTKPYDVAQRSRWVSGYEVVSGTEESPELLVEALERRTRDWPGWALYPSNDEALVALARYKDRLSRWYQVLAPTEDAVASFVDKERMIEVACAVGVDLPRCYGRASDAVSSSELRFPVVVKPIVGYRFYARFGCKLFVANDHAELRRAVARLAEAEIPGQVFDFIPGPDSQIYAYCLYVDARGEPSAGVTVRKIRQGPPFFGIARVAEVVEDQPHMRDATIEIVRRMGHRGVVAAEFKLDPRDGRLKFIEVNGRSVVYNGLLRKAGLDFAALSWADGVAREPIQVRPSRWPGVWIHLHADLLYSAFFRRHERLSLSDFLAPYRRPKTFAVWSASDPGPFLAQWSRTAAEGAAALWRGRPGEAIADRTRAPVAFGTGHPAIAGLSSETTARNFS